MSARTESELRDAQRGALGLVLAVVLIAALVVGVRASYGFFSSDYRISALFPRAGTGLREGSDVLLRGVTVGKVHSISLEDRQARVTLQLHKGVKIPAAAKATIEPKTLFGDDFVNIQFRGAKPQPPFVADGGHLRRTAFGTELEDLFDGADPLLRNLDQNALVQVISNMADTLRGYGKTFGHFIDVTTKATGLLDNTMTAQLQTLDALGRLLAGSRGIGKDLRAGIDSANRALPLFVEARANYDKALDALMPLSRHLSSFLSVNEIDIDRFLDHNGDFLRVLLARRPEIAQTIYGIYRFVYRVSEASSADVLPPGAHSLYIKAFQQAGDIFSFVCNSFRAMSPPGFSDVLDSLGQALSGLNLPPGIQLACNVNGGSVANPSATTSSAPSSSATAATAPSASSASPTNLGTSVYSALGQPNGDPTGMGRVLSQLLGGVAQ